MRAFRLILSLACVVASAAIGADWPMWRGDANRSGASAEALPETLHARWMRKLALPRPAWPNEPRLHFDASYEPVVLGKALFLGSPNDATLTAYSTETGKRLWTFLAGGPVRLAPVAWGGRVCFGSDDGFLYCLDAASGALRWKARGAPDERPDRRHLGNARLISFWPVRGGPVLADGTIYFGAGLWPTLGVFVVAVEAESGRVLWRNAEANLIEKVRIDHNELSDTGLSPQGYLVVAGDLLLVPNGRSMPAVLDRKTGKVLRYIQGYRHGDCRVAAMGSLAFVGRAGAVDISTGREVGSRFGEAGDDAPKRFDVKKVHLFEGPIFPYKMQPGLSAWSALERGVVYGSQQGVFYAYDLTRPAVSEYETKLHGTHPARPWRWDLPELWKLATEHAKGKPASDALIKAGSRLYGHAGKTLLAVELPAEGAQPKVAWQHALDGTPTSMLAADGKLFVATKEGALHCFAGEKAEMPNHPFGTAPLPKADDAWTRRTADILKASGAHEGYALVLGLGTGRLFQELLLQSNLRIIGVDADAAKVRALHERLVDAGVYGTRAELFVGDPFEFPFPPYLASLIVSEQGFPSKAVMDRLLNALRPYGGALCLDADDVSDASVLRRDGPLPGSAAWTHECADAARSYFSKDQLVKPPLGILWYGQEGENEFWSNNDYGIGVKSQVVGGRVFAFSLPMRALFAYDAYTGRHLWKAKADPFTRFAALPDGIYVAAGDACTVLDPATGAERVKFTYKAADEKDRKPLVSDIRVGDDTILIAVAFEKVRAIEKGLWDSTLLVALDRKTGATLWTRRAKHRFNNNALALGGGSVFVVDSAPPNQAVAPQDPKGAPKAMPSEVLALDARTGAVRWSTAVEHRAGGMGSWLAVRSNDDWLASCDGLGLLLAGKLGQARAFEAASGKLAWEGRVGAQPLILRGDTFVDQGGNVFDARTGGAQGSVPLSPRGGCNYAVGSQHLFYLRDRTVCYVDPLTRVRHHVRNARSGCSNSLIAADGILSVPNYTVGCVCNYPIRCSFAMVHMPEVADWAGTTPVRLGPAALAPAR
ncbi:MAG TPA: PQQ-binding-like beta-propeller repeat protein [Planctomycetota bacterium]|nr:PQQ-binding-like beta-propeller repeat protein [Planctomycetota bacterium]